MKYLRKYNESNLEGLTEEEVRDFCEMNLVYLMDDGLKVLVQKTHFGFGHAAGGTTYYKVTLSFRRCYDSRGMNKKWIDIKDHVIPFLTRLRNEYDLQVEVQSSVWEIGSMRVPTNISIEMIGSDSTYPDWFNINDIISEKIVPAGRLRDDYRVLSIQFKIKGEKV